MISPTTIRAGTVVQIDPESVHKKYWACFMFVKKVNPDDDTIEGYIISPDPRGTILDEIKVSMDDVEYIGQPKWVPEECLPPERK
jgi:hypothetical protein